jgi:hypothetical protein
LADLLGQSFPLYLADLLNVLMGQVEHGVQFPSVAGLAFRGALDLDESRLVVHYHVHVGFRIGVLRIVRAGPCDPVFLGGGIMLQRHDDLSPNCARNQPICL